MDWLGPQNSLKYLKRTVRWTAAGIEWAVNPHHLDALRKAVGLDSVTANGTDLPMTKEVYKHDDTRPPLSGSDAKLFRSLAARVNYVAADRPDLSLAACVLASRMAVPRGGDLLLVKRVVRYMRAFPDLVMTYAWQEDGPAVRGTTDTDWATGPATRVSKSGGTITCGTHTHTAPLV